MMSSVYGIGLWVPWGQSGRGEDGEEGGVWSGASWDFTKTTMATGWRSWSADMANTSVISRHGSSGLGC